MISKQQIKFINSLKHNKYRLKYNFFIAEGELVIKEFINSNFEIRSIFSVFESKLTCKKNIFTVTQSDLSKISCLKSPSNILAIIHTPKWMFTELDLISQKRIILLDSISDPGNMGTIIRTADWYGINHIYVSKSCVDVFNPKVVQATMGSLARVQVHIVDLPKILQKIKKLNRPCYGTTLSGDNVYNMKKPDYCALVFGNESHGISKPVLDLLDKKILIPAKNKSIDSLNVSIAFGIILSEFR